MSDMRFTDAHSCDVVLRLFQHLGVDAKTVGADPVMVESVGRDEVIVRWESFMIMPAEDFARIMATDEWDVAHQTKGTT